MSNQNQIDAQPTASNADEIEDLSLSAEVAEETKGGETAAYGRHEGAFMGNLFGSTPTAK